MRCWLLRILLTRTTNLPLGGMRPVLRFLSVPGPPLAASVGWSDLARSNTAIHQRCAGKYFGSGVARHNSTPPGDSPAVSAAADCTGKSAPFLRPTRERSPPPPAPRCVRPSAAAAAATVCSSSTLILWQSIRTACLCLYFPATFPTHPHFVTTIRFLDFLLFAPSLLHTHARTTELRSQFTPKH